MTASSPYSLTQQQQYYYPTMAQQPVQQQYYGASQMQPTGLDQLSGYDMQYA